MLNYLHAMGCTLYGRCKCFSLAPSTSAPTLASTSAITAMTSAVLRLRWSATLLALVCAMIRCEAQVAIVPSTKLLWANYITRGTAGTGVKCKTKRIAATIGDELAILHVVLLTLGPVCNG